MRGEASRWGLVPALAPRDYVQREKCYLSGMSPGAARITVRSVRTNQKPRPGIAAPGGGRPASGRRDAATGGQRSFFQRLTAAHPGGVATAPWSAAPRRRGPQPRRPIPDGAWLGILIVIAIVLYSVHAPVLGAVYDAGPLGMLLALPASVGVVLARRNPRAGVGMVLLGTTAITIASINGPEGTPFPWTVPSMLALTVCALVLGYSVPLREAAVTYSALIGISVVLELVGGGFDGAFFVMVWLSLGAGAAGYGLRRLKASEARAEQHQQLGEQERERREVLQEKAKVARELHDVVAHHMSVIAVQAASAEYRLENLSDEARQEFRQISAQSRSSLTELRRILGVLRGDDEGLQLAPQPGIEDLPRIIDSIERAGVRVRFADPEPAGRQLTELSDAASIATYRIVQEALSNVVRHAGGSDATVLINHTAGAVEITVTNSAPSRAISEPMPGSGHGIRGMQERAHALGGTLTAGPRADGGFQVHAWLPLEPVAEQAGSPDERPVAR